MGLVFILTVIHLTQAASGQMRHFDSILYCASSIKTLVEDVNPHPTIATASRILRNIPELLDNCGKQIHAKAYRRLLSRQCINLHELEASFIIKRIHLNREQKGENDLLVKLYSGLIEIIDQQQSRQCGFLNLHLKDVLMQSLENSQCITQAQQIIESFKDPSLTITPVSIFTDLPLLAERIYSTGKICMKEYQKYFPVPCMGEIVKVAKLVSTMGQYKTAASWIWDNVYTLKGLMVAVKQECPKLLQLLLF